MGQLRLLDESRSRKSEKSEKEEVVWGGRARAKERNKKNHTQDKILKKIIVHINILAGTFTIFSFLGKLN